MSLESVAGFQCAFQVEPQVAEKSPTKDIGVYAWRTPQMKGFELPESDDLVVALHIGGSRRVRAIEGQRLSSLRSVPGLLTLLPPGRPAAFRTDGKVSLVSLHVPKATCKAASVTGPHFALRDAFASAAMRVLLSSVQNTSNSLDPSYMAKVADALLCHLERHYARPISSSSSLSAAPGDSGSLSVKNLLAYIEQNLGTKLDLEEMARRACLSRAGLVRGFRNAVGLSPHQYLISRRVQLAQKMLRETDLDLAFLAQELGFSSQSHFTAIFRRIVGCTPGSYRPH